jgi:hypothetical protein
MLTVIAVLLFVLILVVVWSVSNRTQTASASLFFQNVKPSLDKLGFQGESGWCTEEADFIDVLYYLREPAQSKVFSGIPARTLETWLPRPLDELERDMPHNTYDIAFEGTLNRRNSKGTLTLTLTGRRGVRLDVMEHQGLSVAVAPLSFFTQSNIELVLHRFKSEMETCDKGTDSDQMWMVHGIPTHPTKISTCCNLPYLYPLREKKTSKRLKLARRLLSSGYPL